MTVTYPPGHSGAVHRHNAHGFIYVLEGSVVMAVNGGVPVTVSTGQKFYEGPNDIHTVGRNASKTRPAKFLVRRDSVRKSNASFIRGKTAAHREVSHDALFSTAYEVGNSNAF